MKNLKIYTAKMAPSKGITPQILQEQFEWRKSLIWKSLANQIVIADIEEPVWWNRPLESDTFIKQESDGLWSYNLPIILRKAQYKTDYNVLLNKNSIPIALHIQINPLWTDAQLTTLTNIVVKSIHETLIELGVPTEDLVHTGNDLLYKGKKFMGDEQKLANGVFTENTIITLEYTPEEEIFKRLTGKYALTRGITGIIEETHCFTKQQFLDKLLKKITAFMATLN